MFFSFKVVASHLFRLFLPAVLLNFSACSLGAEQQQNLAPFVQVHEDASPAAGDAPQPNAESSPAAPGTQAAPSPVPPAQAAPQRRQRQVSYNSVPVAGQYVAMTFDDGPHAQLTPKLLDELAKRKMRATFYVLGQNAERYPEIIKRIVRDGHELGNHTWSHPYLTRLSQDRVRSELRRTHDIIKNLVGVEMTTMRPPYGAINDPLRTMIHREFGYTIMMWSVDTRDWQRPGASVVTQRIVNGAAAGAVILAHDIHPSTIQAMPAAFDQLLSKGYQFVTVSELLDREQAPAPVQQRAESTGD